MKNAASKKSLTCDHEKIVRSMKSARSTIFSSVLCLGPLSSWHHEVQSADIHDMNSLLCSLSQFGSSSSFRKYCNSENANNRKDTCSAIMKTYPKFLQVVHLKELGNS